MGQLFGRGAFGGQRGPHRRGQRSAGELEHRRQRRVLHEPAYGAERFVDAVHAVGRPQARLDGAAVAVAHVLGDGDRFAGGVARDAAVLHRQQILVGLAADRVILQFVEVRRLHGDGVLFPDVDDERVVVQHHDFVLAAVLGVGDGRFAGTGKAEHGQHELFAVAARETLQAAVAGGVTVARGRAPAERQRALFELAEVPHAENGRAVLLRREEGQPEREVGMRPVRIGVDEDVAFAGNDAAAGVEFFHVVGHELEVQHPAQQIVLESFGNQETGADGEILVKPDDRFGFVKAAEAALINRLAHDLAQPGRVHAGSADDAAGGGGAADDGAIVEHQHVRALRQPLRFRLIHGHAGQLQRARTVFRQLVSFGDAFDLRDVVAVKRGFDDGSYGQTVDFLEEFRVFEVLQFNHKIHFSSFPSSAHLRSLRISCITRCVCVR